MISFNDLVKIYAEKAQSPFGNGEADGTLTSERIKIDRDHLRQKVFELSSPIFQYHYFLFSLIRFQGRVVSFPRHGEV